ncbi:MAG: PIG-L family deacetylase [Clostridiales bacterium]|nr:PIG-L family deacetylase [Clostridiales bacterium]
MKLNNKSSQIFIPSGIKNELALSQTTHLAIAAHQDDIELMALDGVLQCFAKSDKHFTGVVTADGAGSPRNGMYKDYSDNDIKKVRIAEQKKAAVIGEYSALVMLDYPSKEIKNSNNEKIIDDYVEILSATKPEYVYTHNLADKHDTHVAVAVKVIKAIRKLNDSQKPKKVYGCEVWRDLDWVLDSQKILFDTSSHPNISNALVEVFDSQITGGKRYDLAASGRRTAHATYGASHQVDNANSVNYAIDLTPLVYDKTLDIKQYILQYIKAFENDVIGKLNKLV